jgi:hypothetical protein
MESVDVVVEIVVRAILVNHEAAGRPRAAWVSSLDVTHITGVLPSFLVEKICEALALQLLVFAEVPGTGFLLIDPAKFPATDTPHLVLRPSIHRRVPGPAPEEAPAPQGILRSLADFYSAGDESTQR